MLISELLNQAEQLIYDWYIKEYGERYEERYENDFADLENIPLAYTITENNEEIQVNCDLINYKLNQYIDGGLNYVERYTSLQDMINRLLCWLDFDMLVTVEDRNI